MSNEKWLITGIKAVINSSDHPMDKLVLIKTLVEAYDAMVILDGEEK